MIKYEGLRKYRGYELILSEERGDIIIRAKRLEGQCVILPKCRIGYTSKQIEIAFKNLVDTIDFL